MHTDNEISSASPTVKFVNWGIKSNADHVALTGCAIGHERFSDGTRITRTSSVQHASIDYEAREILFQTRNTFYIASFDDYNPRHLENKDACADTQQTSDSNQQEAHVVFDALISQLTGTPCQLYQYVNHDPEKAEAAESKVQDELIQARNTRIASVKSMLGTHDIYLDVGYRYPYWFCFAVCGTGEVITEPAIHLATYGLDSVLIINHYHRSDGLDLRYFCEWDGITFYSDLYNTGDSKLPGKLIIHNSGTSNMTITMSDDSQILLAPNEETVRESK